MITQKSYSYLFHLILSLIVVVLLFTANTLSISYKEALNVFENSSVLSYITNISIYLFGQNDIALRLPFLIFYILAVLLMYRLTDNYFKNEKDRFYSILVFMFLPGVISASLLVNSAIIVTFFTLLYIYYYDKYKKHSIPLLILFLFIDNSFAILFLAIFFFSINKKDRKIIALTFILFCLSMYIYGFTTDGKPRGYFLDTFAIYSTVFSPLLFIYFVYSIYRAGIKNDRTLVWYISSSALLLSLLFSFRQRVYIEDFAPYVVIFIPFMIKNFLHSYRVRLQRFRKKHNIAVILVLFMLALNVFLTIFNKSLYLVLPNVKKHFAYKYHFADEIAKELKSKNIDYIYSSDKSLILRLKFYGINPGTQYRIEKKEISNYNDKYKISYYRKELITIYIKKNEN